MGRKKIWPPKIGTHKGSDRCWWNGRWWNLGPAGSDEARREHGRLISIWSVDPNALPSSDDLLVSELLRDWIASADAPTGKALALARRSAELLNRHHATTPVEEFGPVALRSWQAWLCSQVDDSGKQLWSRATIAHFVKTIRSAWKWAVANERIDYARYEALRTVAPPRFETCRESEPVQAVALEVVRATQERLPPIVRAMTEIQRLTGARPDEVCSMRPANIRRSGRVEVPSVGLVDLDEAKCWVYTPEQHKGRSRRKPRWLVLGPLSQEVLRPFLDRPADSYCFDPRETVAALRAEQREARIAAGGGSGGSRKRATGGTTRTPTRRYHPRSYAEAIARAAAKAGVEHWTPYQLRHAFAGEVDYAMGLDHAQAAMGHAGPDVTRRYAKRSFRAAVEVATKTG
jgi:integrase